MDSPKKTDCNNWGLYERCLNVEKNIVKTEISGKRKGLEYLRQCSRKNINSLVSIASLDQEIAGQMRQLRLESTITIIKSPEQIVRFSGRDTEYIEPYKYQYSPGLPTIDECDEMSDSPKKSYNQKKMDIEKMKPEIENTKPESMEVYPAIEDMNISISEIDVTKPEFLGKQPKRRRLF